MELNVTLFAKKRTTRDGKKFYNFITSLTEKSTGERVSCRVRFTDADNAPRPESCPVNLVVTRANMQHRNIVREDTGEEMTVHTLWIQEYELSTIPYVDHSLDDFE